MLRPRILAVLLLAIVCGMLSTLFDQFTKATVPVTLQSLSDNSKANNVDMKAAIPFTLTSLGDNSKANDVNILPSIRVGSSVDCSALVNGDQDEIARAETYQEQNTGSGMLSIEDLKQLSQNCPKFREQRHYIHT